MTLVLAIKALDGVVLASDSQATTGPEALRTRTATRKLDDLHGRIAFGCSGSAGLRQRVVAALREQISAADCRAPISAFRPTLHEVVNSLQRQAVAEHVRLDGMSPPCLEMLFAGFSEGSPWIYEISADGSEEEHDPAEAIGTARHYAVYGMVHHLHLGLTKRPLKQVRLVAYRIVFNTIEADASGSVGVPVQLYEVRDTGAHRVTELELKAMHDALNGLKEQECDLWFPSAEPAVDEVEGLRVD